MQFGYFTLADNRYPDNPRSAESFIKDIYAEALWAEQVGLNSAWIGEHHFNLLGVNASPLAMLAQLAGATTKLRLAPAVTLLPVHHPLHVAEEWATLDLLSGGRVDFAAGRGYDLSDIRARDVQPADFEEFHWVLAMDQDNLDHLFQQCPESERHKVQLLLEAAPRSDGKVEVPDPYYGGVNGFMHVLDLLEPACDALVMQIHDRLRQLA